MASASVSAAAASSPIPQPPAAIDVAPIPRAKRLLDVGLSGIGLVCSSPIWALLAAVVKLEDGGPIFYGQERVGEGGRIFHAYKFRSMIPDAEAKVGALQASEHDPRVTRIGRLMRATAMDELPQLWSIFVGDMSFVGPRALRPGEIEVRGDGTTRSSRMSRDLPSATASAPDSPASRRSTPPATFRAATSSGTTVSTSRDGVSAWTSG